MKPFPSRRASCHCRQPPSGGCVLKHQLEAVHHIVIAAAFGRLCVETDPRPYRLGRRRPAAFGRLCVETLCFLLFFVGYNQPPSGGCVLKLQTHTRHLRYLTAAFGRLCVETKKSLATEWAKRQPPSGGCVLKQAILNQARRKSCSRLRAAVC